MNQLKTIRITYQNADIKVRELYTLNSKERRTLYHQLQEFFNIQEALILSTCNRTEIYYLHEDDLSTEVIGLLSSIKGTKNTSFREYFSAETDSRETLKHLFRVAVGLESQVLGDMQIYGQVKEAYGEACNAGMAGTFLHRSLHTLFYAHKQLCQQTSFKSGAASVAYNAAILLKERGIAQADSSILIAGTGKMGIAVCRHLFELGYTNITLTNRSPEKPLELQMEIPVKILPFSALFNQLENFDVLISSISSEQPFFQADKFAGKKLLKKPACLDLSAPRSFCSGFTAEYASSYFDIDYIGSKTEETISLRQQQIPMVEAIVGQSLEELHHWFVEWGYTSQIKIFKDALEQLKKESIAQYLKKLDSAQMELVDEFSSSLIQRIVKLSAINLKQACTRGEAARLNETLQQLFNPDSTQVLNLKTKKSHEHFQEHV